MRLKILTVDYRKNDERSGSDRDKGEIGFSCKMQFFFFFFFFSPFLQSFPGSLNLNLKSPAVFRRTPPYRSPYKDQIFLEKISGQHLDSKTTTECFFA
ncbi:hypothetical protein M5689_022043 [Euphorbia peplus]|nr:hypothetical protein M5689_022043 [Euphorbia peplus]